MYARKVESSFPDEAILFLSIDRVLPAAFMAMGSTQPLTEMSTRNILGGKRAAGA
jgi:hypothetical protein